MSGAEDRSRGWAFPIARVLREVPPAVARAAEVFRLLHYRSYPPVARTIVSSTRLRLLESLVGVGSASQLRSGSNNRRISIWRCRAIIGSRWARRRPPLRQVGDISPNRDRERPRQ